MIRRHLVALAATLAIALGYIATNSSRAIAADDAKATGTFEVYKDKGGSFRWRLVAVNKNVIATSGQGYKDKRDCLAGVESVKKNAANAAVAEVADEKE